MLEEKSAERTAIKLSMAQSPTSRGSQKDKKRRMIVYLREMTYRNVSKQSASCYEFAVLNALSSTFCSELPLPDIKRVKLRWRYSRAAGISLGANSAAVRVGIFTQ